jgi:hypothetical protein
MERPALWDWIVPEAGVALFRTTLQEAHESVDRLPSPFLVADLLKPVPEAVGRELNQPELAAHDIP